jgi:hypothetical protein
VSDKGVKHLHGLFWPYPRDLPHGRRRIQSHRKSPHPKWLLDVMALVVEQAAIKRRFSPNLGRSYMLNKKSICLEETTK